MTALIPGVVLEDRPLPVSSNGLTYDYDPVGLAAGVPILDVVERKWYPSGWRMWSQSACSDKGTDSAGQPSYAARMVTLHGPEFLNLTPVAPRP